MLERLLIEKAIAVITRRIESSMCNSSNDLEIKMPCLVGVPSGAVQFFGNDEMSTAVSSLIT